MTLRIARGFFCWLALMAAAVPLAASDAKPEAKMIDSGSFGIYVAGKRVATETFQIEQVADGSVTRSELKAEEATTKAVQSSELDLNAAGDLRRYVWKELSPGKAQAVVEPQDQFLMEHVVGEPTEKPIDQPYILPASTAILDDYFFIHRELLAWRYLGSDCRPVAGQSGCKLAPAKFGALIPRQRVSLLVTLEYIGPETITIRGQQRRLSRFNLQGDGMDWALWLDDTYKLVRVVIAANNTEVVRE